MSTGFDIKDLVAKVQQGVSAGKVAPAEEADSREESLEEFCSNFERDLRGDSSGSDVSTGLNERASSPNATPLLTPSSPQSRSGTTNDPDAFYGAKAPAYVMQEEKAQHRVICYLAAEGNTRNEIAEKTGFSPVMIGYTLKQPWAQKRIAEIIRQHGGDHVEAALKGAVLDCANLLISTVRDSSMDIKVRSSNAKEILDRVYGKSNQVVTHVNVSPEDLTDEDLAKHLPKAGLTDGSGTEQ